MKKVEQFHMMNDEPTLAIPGEYSNVDHHLGNLWHSYWTWSFIIIYSWFTYWIVDLPNLNVVIFQFAMFVFLSEGIWKYTLEMVN